MLDKFFTLHKIKLECVLSIFILILPISFFVSYANQRFEVANIY